MLRNDRGPYWSHKAYQSECLRQPSGELKQAEVRGAEVAGAFDPVAGVFIIPLL
jgi:hypothetical protein